MKVIAILNKPKSCSTCPFNHVEISYEECRLSKRQLSDAESLQIPIWCELRHPLKWVSKDFYIYDRKYLIDHLDREIELLQSTKRFEEYMKAMVE